jgi:hypothetical protein
MCLEVAAIVSKYDYISLKNQYVQGSMSIRELCRQNNIPTWSAVNARAKRDDWDQKRIEFNRQVENKSLEHLAQKRAMKIAEIQVDSLEVIHAGILKMAEDMDAIEEYEVNGVTKTRKVMRIHPRDLAILLDKFQSLIGAPQQISENRNLGVDILSQADPETLRDLLGVLRPQQIVGPAEGAAARGHPSSTRSN